MLKSRKNQIDCLIELGCFLNWL